MNKSRTNFNLFTQLEDESGLPPSSLRLFPVIWARLIRRRLGKLHLSSDFLLTHHQPEGDFSAKNS